MIAYAMPALGIAALVAVAIPDTPAWAATPCQRSQYGTQCTAGGDAYSPPVRLGVRYAQRPNADQVLVDNGWIDGSDDGGHTWKGPLLGPRSRFEHKTWRGCMKTFAHGYQCTPWVS